MVARPPTPRELDVLRRSLEKQLAFFSADKPAADKLLAYGDTARNTNLDAGEYAAWTMIANMLINLDETITK